MYKSRGSSLCQYLPDGGHIRSVRINNSGYLCSYTGFQQQLILVILSNTKSSQWHSYTWAYPGLCPHKIRWYLDKNYVESCGQRSVISMCEHKFHVDMKRAYR